VIWWLDQCPGQQISSIVAWFARAKRVLERRDDLDLPDKDSPSLSVGVEVSEP